MTRKYVLGIVYELIAERGIENISMRAVAEAVGYSTGTINYHFRNKYSLLIEALESAYQLPDDWEDYRGSPAAQLRRLATGYVRQQGKDRFWRFWINYLALGTRDEEILRHQAQRYKRQENFWAKLIADGIAAKEFKPSLDAHDEARRFLVLAHGVLVHQLVLDDAEASAYARQTIDAGIDAMLTNSTPMKIDT